MSFGKYFLDCEAAMDIDKMAVSPNIPNSLEISKRDLYLDRKYLRG
jgi:hypothetical protein